MIFLIYSFCYQIIQSLNIDQNALSSKLMYNSGSIAIYSHGDASHCIFLHLEGNLAH